MPGIQSKSRYDWYQSEGKVTVTILKRGVSIEECSAQVEGKHLTVKVKDEEIFQAELYDQIDGRNMTVTCTPSKIEISMPKLNGDRWPSMESQSTSTSQNNQVNSSSKNWDQVGKEVEKEEEDQGGVDKLFQKIYKDADDDVRKAMMKSYTESCGTVLSTNWDEIKKGKTEVKPPDSMEHKKYEK